MALLGLCFWAQRWRWLRLYHSFLYTHLITHPMLGKMINTCLMNICWRNDNPREKSVTKLACACSPNRGSGTVASSFPPICFPPVTRRLPTAFLIVKSKSHTLFQLHLLLALFNTVEHSHLKLLWYSITQNPLSVSSAPSFVSITDFASSFHHLKTLIPKSMP